MHKLVKLLPAALLCCAALAQAQLYKSVGPDGRVTYSDAPPASARTVETRPLPSGGATAAALPYELAQVARAHPVTLYTADKCEPCASARSLLAARGVPYAEKTVSSNEDIAALRAAGGQAQLPLLTVGRSREQGFEEGAWNNTLSAAGYPQASQLPAGWRNPPAQSAAPRSAEKAAAAQAPAPAASVPAVPRAATEAPAATGKAPPGFRF
ncbi:MAG: glutaredoxin family protein [Noviherbaspirillum sp.]